jgi:ABC-type multidrug transport system ATPase subunit
MNCLYGGDQGFDAERFAKKSRRPSSQSSLPCLLVGMIAKDNFIKLRVDRVTEAYELLLRNPLLSLSRNGDQSLHVKTSEEQIPLINTLLAQHGFRVMELSPQRESLEQVFLRLTQEGRTEGRQGVLI